MKEFFTSWKSVIGLSFAAALLIAPFAASEWATKRMNSVKNLEAGSTTCFTRVGQTFTALMIKDFSSNYLGKNFTSMTGECFGQLNQNFENLFGSSFTEAQKPLNKLNSDLFWFHEKTGKLLNMAQDGAIELTPSSNILNKFSSLESLNIEFQSQLAAKVSSMAAWRNVWIGLSLFGAFLLSAMTLVLGRKRQNEKNKMAILDREARELLENELKSDMIHAKTSRVMEGVFKTLDAPHCFELFARVQEASLENKKQLSSQASLSSAAERRAGDRAQDDIEANEVNVNVNKETSHLNSLARGLVERMSDKVFTGSIQLEESLEEDFLVEGNKESLEQLLYNLLSFAIECRGGNDRGQKVALKSKALGGIAYFKTRISNCLLNPDEMEFFNGKLSEATQSSGNVNLLLLQEISKDLGVSLAARNVVKKGSNFTGAEIEVIFKRARLEKSAPASSSSRLKSLRKGKKRDLISAFQSEA